jgi:hypothetical protein
VVGALIINAGQIPSKVKPPTGEPCAGEPHARFGGGRGRVFNRPFLPLSPGSRCHNTQKPPKGGDRSRLARPIPKKIVEYDHGKPRRPGRRVH